MPTPNPQQMTAHRDKTELAVEQFGDSSAATVLLIHGAGNSLTAWPPSFCAELAQNRPVIRYDTRDAGQSTTWPVGEPGYTLPDLVEDASAVLTATGRDSAHLVGVSMGSAIAQLLALDHPAQVASLTIISGTPGGPGHEAADLPEMTPQMTEVFSTEPEEPDWSNREAVIRYLSESERPFQGEAFDEDHQRAIASATLERAQNLAANLTNHFMMDPGSPWRQRLGEITVPTLVLHGDADPLFPAEHSEALAREIPGAQLHLLRRMGHGFPPPAYWPEIVPLLERHFGTQTN
ncbi:MAG: alpha/beta fold hydrolase [Nocardioides sp.]|nr:alpha/beta fold hydrolase [Nocardioides sp.]